MLNSNSLKSELEQMFQGLPKDSESNYTWSASTTEAGQKLAQIYTIYAKDATPTPPGGGTPITTLLSAAQNILAGALAVAFEATEPSSVASNMSTAFTAFWVGMQFTNSCQVTGIVGTAVLASGLTATWTANLANKIQGVSASTAAQQHATLLDVFTKTVATVMTSPPNTPGTLV